MSVENESNDTDTSDEGNKASVVANPDGSEKPSSGKQDEVVSRAELEEVRKQRDKFKTELANAKKALKSKSDTEFDSESDVAKLRDSAKAREAELLEDNRKLTERMNRRLLEDSVRNELRAICAEGLDDVAYLYLKDHFELGEDDKPRVKDSVLDIRAFATQTLEKAGKTGMLKNSRVPGAGARKDETSADGVRDYSMAELNRMSVAEQRAAFRANPKLIDKVFSNS